MRLLLVDNHDSFTWNLVHAFEVLGARVEVVLNDAVTVDEVSDRRPEAVVISPGPGRPEASGITLETVERLGGRVPILGVCLGHQAIAVAAGGMLESAETLVHGKTSLVFHRRDALFRDVPSPFPATRYHSLSVVRDSLPAALVVDAWTADRTVMAIRHRTQPLWGVQFHPESYATEHGPAILERFLALARQWRRDRRRPADISAAGPPRAGARVD